MISFWILAEVLVKADARDHKDSFILLNLSKLLMFFLNAVHQT